MEAPGQLPSLPPPLKSGPGSGEWCASPNRALTVLVSPQTINVKYTQGDTDLVSIRIYASWLLPPFCG